jgi:hypothetical protein
MIMGSVRITRYVNIYIQLIQLFMHMLLFIHNTQVVNGFALYSIVTTMF